MVQDLKELQKLNLQAKHQHLQMQILALFQKPHKVKDHVLISAIKNFYDFWCCGELLKLKEHLQSLHEYQTGV